MQCPESLLELRGFCAGLFSWREMKQLLSCWEWHTSLKRGPGDQAQGDQAQGVWVVSALGGFWRKILDCRWQLWSLKAQSWVCHQYACHIWGFILAQLKIWLSCQGGYDSSVHCVFIIQPSLVSTHLHACGLWTSLGILWGGRAGIVRPILHIEKLKHGDMKHHTHTAYHNPIWN